MSVSETYGVLFAAIGAADFLLVIWLAVTIALNTFVFFCSERIEQGVYKCLQALYLLFAIFIIGRWGVVVSKVTELIDSLRDAGESLPPASITAFFGLAGLIFVIAFSAVTLRYLRSGIRKTRVI